MSEREIYKKEQEKNVFLSSFAPVLKGATPQLWRKRWRSPYLRRLHCVSSKKIVEKFREGACNKYCASYCSHTSLCSEKGHAKWERLILPSSAFLRSDLTSCLEGYDWYSFAHGLLSAINLIGHWEVWGNPWAGESLGGISISHPTQDPQIHTESLHTDSAWCF